MTVAGFTSISALRQSVHHREKATQKARSTQVSFGRFVRRPSTASCCLQREVFEGEYASRLQVCEGVASRVRSKFSMRR